MTGADRVMESTDAAHRDASTRKVEDMQDSAESRSLSRETERAEAELMYLTGRAAPSVVKNNVGIPTELAVASVLRVPRFSSGECTVAATVQARRRKKSQIPRVNSFAISCTTGRLWKLSPPCHQSGAGRLSMACAS